MKTYDLPITHNKLKTRDEVAQSLLQILEPCGNALVHNNAGLFVGNTGAAYGPRGALLEGWSRLLWGLVPLKAGGYSWKDQEKHREGFISGPDTKNEAYWGDVSYADQRIVEMAAMAMSLLLTPEYYWEPLTGEQRDNLSSWLGQVNRNDFPHNNWLYFRILVNLALEKHQRPEFDPELMEKDLSEVEDMYASDGWYRDKVPFDYYNPWAMQYYSMIYYKFKKDTDIARCQRFKKRVKLFAQQYVYFFNQEGENVPFGRSLTYRFGGACFFSACAFADIEVLPWGVMKGIVLRNLRWWFKQPIFDRDGFLTIGYVNPTLIIGEQYNAPGSPYWSLKTYTMLALPSDHPFWTSEELPLPPKEKSKLLENPGMIAQETSDDDAILLNGGQYPPYHMMHYAEKYGKFAYSAHYGFSASSSYMDFEKTGCDSMLYVSDDGEIFKPRTELQIVKKCEEYVETIWHPFKDTEITTYLIPSGDFHVRVHKIKAGRDLLTKEGGFAIALYKKDEIEVKPIERQDNQTSLSIEMPWDVSVISSIRGKRIASSVIPTPNLNYIATNTIVPVLSGTIKKGEISTYVTLVGAHRKEEKDFYRSRPLIEWNEDKSLLSIDNKCILLS